MRKTIIFCVSLFVAFFILFAGKTMADPMTVHFTTLGNCYLCKVRIENAVNALDGIEQVDWKSSEEVTTVTYDDTITDPFIIMDAIAYVGHDTEWYPAPDSAYNSLVGTCCEYDRTIDYTNVQVGYLSLMDLWVTHVGIADYTASTEISVYPTVGSGIFNVSFSGMEISRKYILSVYNLNGVELYNTEIEGSSEYPLDINNFSKGQYVVVLKNNGTALARTKIIKL